MAVCLISQAASWINLHIFLQNRAFVSETEWLMLPYAFDRNFWYIWHCCLISNFSRRFTGTHMYRDSGLIITTILWKRVETHGGQISISLTAGWPDNIKFPDISLMVCGTPAHVKLYSYHVGTVSGGATLYDLKPKWNAQTQQSQEWTQICS